jgi:hypothetical protein
MVALGGLFALAAPALAQQPTQAQVSAIRGACRGDYQSVCANVPTGGQQALQCLQQHAAQVSAGCQQALAPLGGGQSQAPAAAPPSATVQAPPAAAAGPPPPPPGPMSMREEMRLLRADCGADYRRFCADVRPGGGRGLACLRANWPQLQPACRSAMLAAQRR